LFDHLAVAYFFGATLYYREAKQLRDRNVALHAVPELFVRLFCPSFALLYI